MKTVPYQELKRHLSGLLTEAASGERILVTRRGEPAALLVPAHEEHMHIGDLVGKGKLEPAFTSPATRGKYLAVLEADRAEHDRDR